MTDGVTEAAAERVGEGWLSRGGAEAVTQGGTEWVSEGMRK